MGRHDRSKMIETEEIKLFDRFAVAFFAGSISFILLTAIWALLAWEFDIVSIPYWMVIAISAVTAIIGFLLHTNLIAKMLTGLVRLVAGLFDE